MFSTMGNLFVNTKFLKNRKTSHFCNAENSMRLPYLLEVWKKIDITTNKYSDLSDELT